MTFLLQMLAYGGGSAAVAYLLFQWLGKTWIENKFAQRLDQLRHQQALELQRLRVEIDAMLSGALKLQEDLARADRLEGVGGTKAHIPLRFKYESSPELTIQGGTIGQKIVPHYILSLHGTALSEEYRSSFGGHTFGVKCIARLAAEVLYQASKQLCVHGYRFGPVSYQHTAICISHSGQGAAIGLGGTPQMSLRSLDTDVLRKEPVEPFISQDEWRIVVFPASYVKGDPKEPLKINVSPDHFFEYIRS